MAPIIIVQVNCHITTIAHGEDVLLQHAPPTTGVCSRSALHSHSHSTIHACEFASARRLIVQYLCMIGTLPAMTTAEPI